VPTSTATPPAGGGTGGPPGGGSGGTVTTLAAPSRVADTRLAGGPIAAGQARCFAVAGQAAIPAAAIGVVLNVTGVGYAERGWLTVYPSGEPLPATSTLNVDPSAYAIANGTLVRLGPNGRVCVAVGSVGSGGRSDVVLDATGYLTTDSPSQLPLLAAPQRVVDTRSAGGPIQSGQSRCFSFASVPGVPSDAAGVVLNVTAVSYTTRGWLSVYPKGSPVPATSSLNFDPAAYAVANGSIMRLGADQSVCVAVGTVNGTPGGANVVLDLTGYLTSAGLSDLPLLAAPQRLVDTRTSGGPIATGQTRCFTIAGAGGLPATATQAVLTVTAVSDSAPGWLTVYPAGQPVPATSTLNFDPHAYALANSTVTAVGAGGQVCVAVGTINGAPGSVHVILDATGAGLGASSQLRRR